MKRFALGVIVTALLFAGIMILFPACSKEKVDVEKILDYQSRSSYNDVVFTAGKSEYCMNVSLGALTGEYFVRDGAALMNTGTLDGMVFEMQNGALKLKTGDFEMSLNEKDSPAMYALFAAFSIEPSEFTSITESESDPDKLTARFGGRYKFDLTLNEAGELPERISVETDKDTYTVSFGGKENSGE